MRHLSNYIALSLLAAAFAGCSSTDTGSTSTSSSGGQDPLTGPLAVYQGKIAPLGTACAYDSVTSLGVTVTLAAGEVAVISKRAVDSALLVNGATCVDVVPATPVTALTTKLKTIDITGPGGSAETVLFDIRNGTYALASASSVGITVDLGGGNDEVAILGSTGSDKLGCKVSGGKDALGLKSATSVDVKVTGYAGNKFTVDLSDGDDGFDKGDCTSKVEIFGGKGKDTILAGSDSSVAGDKFHGGADADTISYASRSSKVTVAPDGAADSGDNDGSVETDTVGADFETIIGGKGDDVLAGGADTTMTYTLNGGDGNDTMSSTVACATIFNGGNGTDTVDYSGRGALVLVNMGDGKATDGQSGDKDNVGKDVENLIGTDHGDTLTGNALNNVFTTGTGNDIVSGGDGDDTFVAKDADGDDTFNGGNGSDTIDYSARTSAGVCINMDGNPTSGDCAVDTSGASPVWDSAGTTETDTIALDVENAVGTAGDDHIVGNVSANVLLGLGGTDKLEGKAANDTLDDNLYTSAGGNTCNPVTLACFGALTGACDCATAVLTPTCNNGTAATDAAIDCGNDALDVASCFGAAGSQFTSCWKTQK